MSHDPSEIILICWFFQVSLIRLDFFKFILLLLFYFFTKVFPVTFDQFNAFLTNKSINLKKITDPKLLNNSLCKIKQTSISLVNMLDQQAPYLKLFKAHIKCSLKYRVYFLPSANIIFRLLSLTSTLVSGHMFDPPSLPCFANIKNSQNGFFP